MTKMSSSQFSSDGESHRFRDGNWIRKWFDPDRYDEADILDASGWVSAIMIRRDLKRFGEDPDFWGSGPSSTQAEIFERSIACLYGSIDEPWDLPPEMEEKWHTSEKIAKVLGFGIHQNDRRSFVLRSLCMLLAEPLPQPLFSASYGGSRVMRSDGEAGVFDLTLYEYVDKFRAMSTNPALEDFRKLQSLYREGSSEAINEYLTFLQQDATEFWRSRNVPMDYEAVGVNLFATDKEISADIKSWLKRKRKQLGVESRRTSYSQKKFTSWRDMGVLPYIDLNLVQLFCGKSISDQMIGDLLFSDERVMRFAIKEDVDRPYRVRITVKNHADGFMTAGKDSRFRAICAQAARGAYYRNVKKKRKNKSRD